MSTVISEKKGQLEAETVVSCPETVNAHTKHFEKGIYKVTDGVYVAIGYALANSICIESSNSLIIVDVLEDLNTARILCSEFKKLCNNKPISDIIFTHGHADHCRGIKGFTENEKILPKIYFHEKCIESWKSEIMFKGGTYTRAYRQFGTLLSHQIANRNEKEWFKNAGIGLSLNVGAILDNNGEMTNNEYLDSFVDFSNNGKNNIITFGNNGYKFKCNNLTFELFEAFGESDDQIFIICREKQLLLVGDNFYHSFPNLYAIRGVSPRNGYAWYKSIESFMKYTIEYNINYMIPSHGKYLNGKEHIYNTFSQYRDGIAFIYDQTLRYLNQGYDTEIIIDIIKNNLPQTLFGQKDSFLTEYYGTIEWGIKGIATKILGWFHTGKPVDLFPASKHVRGNGIMSLLTYISTKQANGCTKPLAAKIIDYCQKTLDNAYNNSKNEKEIDNANRWILELITWLRQSLLIGNNNNNNNNNNSNNNENDKEMLKHIANLRYKIFENMASYQTSMPARNYLLTYLFEEKYDFEVFSGTASEEFYKHMILDWWIFGMSFYVDPLKCSTMKNDENVGLIILHENENEKKTFRLTLKKIGVLQVELVNENDETYNRFANENVDWIVDNSTKNMKQFLIGAIKAGSSQRKAAAAAAASRGHEVARIRTGVAIFIELLRLLIKMKAKCVVKGANEAQQFVNCLENKFISKL